MDTATQVIDPTETGLSPAAGDSGPSPAAASAPDSDGDLLVEELRIDDLSIDGMCGVY